jgi:hypothetical protein
MPSGFTRSSRVASIPKVKRQTAMPQPKKVFGSAGRRVFFGGPELFAAQFIGPTTSKSEGYIYWALLKVLGPAGEGSWGYQISSNNSATIIDFVIWNQQPRLAWRVQSERFHIATLQYKHTYDRLQKEMLERSGYKVIDLYEEHFLKDKTGRAAILLVKDALKGRQRPSPIRYKTGLARPV